MAFPDVLTDLRIAARSLRRRPGFTLTAAGTLALGIGATTAVFGMVNQMLLRPPPGIRAGESAGYVEFHHATEGRQRHLSAPEFEELREGASLLEGLAAFGHTSLLFSAGDEVIAAWGQPIQGDYFELLGVQPLIGRLLTDEETRADAADVMLAVISEGLWTTAFGRDANIVGKVIRTDDHTLTIVGVAGGGFQGPIAGDDIDLWLPAGADAVMSGYSLSDQEHGLYAQLIARPRRGVSFSAAEAQLEQIHTRIPHAGGDDPKAELDARIFPRLGTDTWLRKPAQTALRALMGVVLIVLLISCANVTNMLLFRGVHRRGEMAVRRALGASHMRVARQDLAESLILATLGAAGAIAVAFACTKLLGGMGFVYYLRIEVLTVDTRLLGFLTAVLVLTTVTTGALPALITGRVDAARALGAAGLRETGRGGRLRATVTVVQLALSVCLLVGALLLVRTVRNLYATDPGFEVDGVTAVITSSARKLELDQIEPFQRRVIEELRSIPGVENAALDVYGPFGPGGFRARVRTPGTAEADAIQVTTIPVSPGWFETLRLPILRGRSFTEADWSEAGAQYVVLSENIARRVYGDADPIGRSLMLQTGDSVQSAIVIGVARAAHLQSVDRAPTEVVYRSYATAQIYGVTGLVRAPGVDAAVLAEQIREAIRRAAPDLPAPYIDTLSKRLDNRLAEQRLFARLISLLSSIAVLLAAVGLYGVIAYTVAARTRELGIRMALGARTTRIVRQVLGQAAWLVGIGVTLGLGGALVLARVLEARLFGVSPLDPVTYLGAALLFALVSLAACLAPLRAATHVDPMVALRSD